MAEIDRENFLNVNLKKTKKTIHSGLSQCLLYIGHRAVTLKMENCIISWLSCRHKNESLFLDIRFHPAKRSMGVKGNQ